MPRALFVDLLFLKIKHCTFPVLHFKVNFHILVLRFSTVEIINIKIIIRYKLGITV